MAKRKTETKNVRPPRTVYFGSRWIPLGFNTFGTGATGTDYWGMMSPGSIELQSGMGVGQTIVTLLHELFHMSLCEGGLHDYIKASCSDDATAHHTEEALCDHFALATFQLLRDNPRLAEWLMQLLGPARGELKEQENA